MSTIFISHSSKDNAMAKELERRLAEKHHSSVFLDLDPEKGIAAGQSWERTLYRKLRACRAVIVVCTDNYLTSQWCFAEIALARMEGKQILALQTDQLSPDAKLPSILTEKQYIDMRTNPEDGYQRLWRGLKEMDLLGVSNEWDPKQSPYLGLNAFGEKHAPVFFGRDDETRAGIELLDRGAPGLIMVLGASGSGKSSIVRAGIVPRLRADEDRWLIVGPFRPREDPFAELAESVGEAYRRYAPDEAAGAEARELVRSLRSAGTGPGGKSDGGERSDVQDPADDERISRLLKQLEELRQNPPPSGGPPFLDFLNWSMDDLKRICGEEPAVQSAKTPRLSEIANHLRRASGHNDARVLLIIDQFEELLGHEDATENANRFLKLLRNAAEAEDSPLMVLGTMRSDFLGLFQHNPALVGIDFASLSVGPMSIEGMRQAIEEPAKLGAIELENGLADRLLQDTETPDALPLLSFTMSVLWRDCREDGRLTVEDYERLGGLQGAIAREADAVLAGKQDKADDVRRAFLQMVRVTEEGNYARIPASWDREEISKVREILKDFETRRLLVTRMEKGEAATVEVAHEALFRSWESLKTWLDNHRSELLLIAQLRRDAKAWEENNCADENLWRGGRLQQSAELMRKGKLGEQDEARTPEEKFVRAGVRRRRNRKRALAGAALSVIAVLSGLLGWALVKRNQAEAAKRKADQRLYVADINRAAQAQADRNLPLVQEILNEYLPGDTVREQSDLRSFPWYYLWHNNHHERATLKGHGFKVTSIAVSPDGKMIASASTDWTVRLWEVGTKKVATLKGHNYWVNSVAFSPDGKTLASASSDKTVKLWDTAVCMASATTASAGSADAGTATCNELRTLPENTKEIASIAFSPDGRFLASGGWDNIVKLWNTATWELLPALEGQHSGHVNAVVFSADSKMLASASSDKTVKLWKLQETGVWGPPQAFSGHKSEVYAVAISPDGRSLATGGATTVRLWDIATGSESATLKGHSAFVDSVAFSPDGRTLASASADQTVKIWAVTTRTESATLKGHSDFVTSVAFLPDGRTLASGSNDKTVKLWNAGTTQDLITLKTSTVPAAQADGNLPGYPGSVALSPDGITLAAAGGGKVVDLWRLQDTGKWEKLTPLTGHTDRVRSVAFSHDGKTIASAGEDTTLELWRLTDTGASENPVTLKGHTKAVTSIAFSPDGKTLASASEDLTVRMWKLSEGGDWEASAELKGEGLTKALTSIAFSPDGKKLASANIIGIVILWKLSDAGGWEQSESLPGQSGGVYSLAFAPDGKTLATAEDKIVKLWTLSNTGASERLGTLEGHTKAVTSIAFSPDGRMLASAGADATVKLWDTALRTESGTLIGHADEVVSIVFSPDGKTLASTSKDGTVKLWGTVTDLTTLHVDPSQAFPNEAQFPLRYLDSVAFSPDGKMLASASNDKTVDLWRQQNSGRWEKLSPLKGHSDRVHSVAFSPDGKTLASAGEDKSVRLWKLTENGELEHYATLEGHSKVVASIAFSPDGKLLASAGEDRAVKLWELSDAGAWVESAPFEGEGHTKGITSVAFSPDGTILASASLDKTVRLWDVGKRKELAPPLKKHEDRVYSVAFSPDGKTLASAGADLTIQIWNIGTRESLATLRGHTSAVYSVAFSPDGKTLASASLDNTVKLWDTSVWQDSATLKGHTGYALSVAFSPDGKTLASASFDKTIKLWIAATDPEVAVQRNN